MSALSHHHSWILEKSCSDSCTSEHEAKHAHCQVEGEALTLDELTALAAGAIKMMGIKYFAPNVLLVGHASHTTNNLHAAGLDCGACGGQSGEVNVRVLAQLLNDSEVRASLTDLGFQIPGNTRFIPAIHNTTTDEISYFDDKVPSVIKTWLCKAKHVAQTERSRHFEQDMQFESDKKRDKLFQQRARDWSQVQPEWGLAGNAAFIIAPRAKTRGMNFEGKSFLHDYTWQQDEDSSILEGLMTAPMIVTHWINMQYNASVTDNNKLGSGNKVLHNAVGGNIGVFEGNSGDLRIGLSRQSLHNGERWMHLPQRLSVYIAAPNKKIAAIIDKHEMLQSLIDNDWLYLFSWERPQNIERVYKGRWYQSHGLSI